MIRPLSFPLALVAAAALLSACSGTTAPTSPAGNVSTSVVSVSPAGGATNVATTTSVTVTFNHAMMAGMEQYIALHRDSLRGPLVMGTMSWSDDHTQITFTPSTPLASHTTYVLHMGGGMVDANGAPIDYGQCPALGGRSVTGGMMGGGMMGGANGSEMGNGWKGTDGGYGMEFVFTTA